MNHGHLFLREAYHFLTGEIILKHATHLRPIKVRGCLSSDQAAMPTQAFGAAGLPAALVVGAEDTRTISHPPRTVHPCYSPGRAHWELKSHKCLRLLGSNSTYRLPADDPAVKFTGRNLGLFGVNTYRNINRSELQEECTNY